MSNRKAAIEELKRQIELGRKRLGPEGVKELERMSESIQSGKSISNQGLKDMETYDKETALKALEIYLENHGDPEELKRQILEQVNKSKD